MDSVPPSTPMTTSIGAFGEAAWTIAVRVPRTVRDVTTFIIDGVPNIKYLYY